VLHHHMAAEEVVHRTAVDRMEPDHRRSPSVVSVAGQGTVGGSAGLSGHHSLFFRRGVLGIRYIWLVRRLLSIRSRFLLAVWCLTTLRGSLSESLSLGGGHLACELLEKNRFLRSTIPISYEVEGRGGGDSEPNTHTHSAFLYVCNGGAGQRSIGRKK
jgi:hypothetical protein